jgi:hypothetical protein
MTRLRMGAAMAVTGALLVAAIVFAVTPGAGAAPVEPVVVTDVGWWTLATSAPKAPGGFQVSESPNNTGDMSVAALKIKVNTAHLGSALFVLNEAKTSVRPDGGGIFACLTTSNWTAGNPGLWSDVPPRDCSRQVQMVRSATQQAWSANLLPLLSGKTGTVSIMFVPGAPGPGSIPVPSLDSLPIAFPSLPVPVVGGVPLPPPAVVALLPPLPSSIAAPVDLGYMVDFSSVLVGAAEAEAALAPPGAADIGSGGAFTAPTFFNDTGLAAAPPLATTTQGATPDEVALPTAAAAVHGPGRPWGRALGFLPVALLIGAAITFGRRFLRERLA